MESGKRDEEVDIYDDLPDFNLEATIQKLEIENKALSLKVKDLSTRVAELETKNNDLNRANKNLRANISALLKTVQKEIQRKDNTINELRQEREDLFLRRKQPKGVPSDARDRPNTPTIYRLIPLPQSNRPENVVQKKQATRTVSTSSSKRDALDNVAAPKIPSANSKLKGKEMNGGSVEGVVKIPGGEDRIDPRLSQKSQADFPLPKKESVVNPSATSIAQTPLAVSTPPKKRPRKTSTARHFVKTRSSARLSARLENSTQEASNDSGAGISVLEALQLEQAIAQSPMPKKLSPFLDNEKSLSPQRFSLGSETNPLTSSTPVSSLLYGALKNPATMNPRDQLVPRLPERQSPSQLRENPMKVRRKTSRREEEEESWEERQRHDNPKKENGLNRNGISALKEPRASANENVKPSFLDNTKKVQDKAPQKSPSCNNDETSLVQNPYKLRDQQVMQTPEENRRIKVESRKEGRERDEPKKELNRNGIPGTKVEPSASSTENVKSSFPGNTKEVPQRAQKGLHDTLLAKNGCDPCDQLASLPNSSLQISENSSELQACSDEARRKSSRCEGEATNREENRKIKEKSLRERREREEPKKELNGIPGTKVEPSASSIENLKPSFPDTKEVYQRAPQRGLRVTSADSSLVKNGCNPRDQQAPLPNSSSRISENSSKLQASLGVEARRRTSRSEEENKRNEEERKHDDNSRKEDKLDINGISSKDVETKASSNEKLKPSLQGSMKEQNKPSGETSLPKNGCLPLKSVKSTETKKQVDEDNKRNTDASALQCDFKVRRRTRIEVKVMVKTPPFTQDNEVTSKSSPGFSTDQTVKASHSISLPPVTTSERTSGGVSFRSPPRYRHSRRDDFKVPGYHKNRDRGFRSPPPRYRYSRRDEPRSHGFNFSRRSRSLSPRFAANRRYQNRGGRFRPRPPPPKLPVDRKEREAMLFGKSPDRSPMKPDSPQRPVVLTVNVRRKNNVQLEDEESKTRPLVPKPVTNSLSSKLVQTLIDFREKYAEVFSNTGESSDPESESTHSKDSDDSYRPQKKRKKGGLHTKTKSKKLCKGDN